MSKLDEFNASISSLQQEVENMQAVELAYKQLAKLVQDYDSVLTNLNTATKDMTTTKVELMKQTSSVSEKLIEQKKVLETAAADQSKELETKLKTLQTMVEKKQDELQQLLNTKLDDISEVNRKFYNDIANTMQTRLDDNKMQIKQLIDQGSEGARRQIEDIKQLYKEQTVLLNKNIEKTQAALEKRLDTQKNISLALGIVITILVIIMIIKLS